MPNSVERPTRVPMISQELADVDAFLDVVRQVEVRVVELGGRRGRLRRRRLRHGSRRVRQDPDEQDPRHEHHPTAEPRGCPHHPLRLCASAPLRPLLLCVLCSALRPRRRRIRDLRTSTQHRRCHAGAARARGFSKNSVNEAEAGRVDACDSDEPPTGRSPSTGSGQGAPWRTGASPTGPADR